MLDNDKSVNVLDSLDDNNQGEKDPSLEGEKASKDLEKKIRENLRGEYERKAQEKVETEKARIVESYEERIKEIESKGRLSSSDEKEIGTLENKIRSIQSNPDYQPCEKIILNVVQEEMSR